jgi:hypothetical protein
MSNNGSFDMISLAVATNERTAQLTRTREALGLERLASGAKCRPNRRTRLRLRLGLRLVVIGTTLLEGSGQRRVSPAGR